MAKAGRGQTRRDSKRRVLRPGESVRADRKNQYKYHRQGVAGCYRTGVGRICRRCGIPA